MKRNLCDCCGGFGRGSVFGTQICSPCRDYVLTYLARIGVRLTDQNPFVAEMCENYAMIPADDWKYYNTDTMKRGIILRLEKKS